MKNSELKRTLTALKRTANHKNVPITENVMIDNGKATTSNLETFQSFNIPIYETGLVNLKFLQDITKSLNNDDDVYIKFVDNKANIFINGENLFNSNSDKIEDFPEISKNHEFTGLVLSTDFLQSFKNFCSNDELRPSMTGILIDRKNLVATNAHKLKFSAHNQEDKLFSCFKNLIIPSSVLPLLNKNENYSLFKLEDYEYMKNYYMLYSESGHEIKFQEIDAKYPDYNCVIPEEQPIKAKVNKTELLKNLKLAGVAANKTTNQIIINFCDGLAVLTSQDIDSGTNFENAIECDVNECLTIGFNINFLIDILNEINSDEIIFSLSTPNRAAILNEDFLLMPVMIKEYSY